MGIITATSSIIPQPIVIEELPDGKQRVVLTKDVTEKEVQQENDNSYSCYEYSEVSFIAPYPLEIGEVEAAFDGWWMYAASASESSPPTLEERITAVEAALAELM